MSGQPQGHTVEVDLRKPKTLEGLSLDVAALVCHMQGLRAHVGLLEERMRKIEGGIRQVDETRGVFAPFLDRAKEIHERYSAKASKEAEVKESKL